MARRSPLLAAVLAAVWLFGGVPGARATSVSVDLAHPGVHLPVDYTGLSFEAGLLDEPWLDPAHGNLLALLKNLNPASLRFGGDSVDDTAWAPAPSSPRPSWASGVVTPGDLGRLGQLARASRWRVDLGVNLARFDPAAAASEARSAASTIGWPLRTIQIGNEPDTYYYNRPERPYLYENYLPDEQAYRAAIHAAAPSVGFAGPDTATKPLNILAGAAYMQIFVVGQWLSPYARDHSTSARFLNQHLYPLTSALGAAGDPTTAELLSRSLAMQTRSTVDAIVAAGHQNRLPVHLDEANSISNGGQAGVSNSFASALWLIDFLLLTAQEDVAQVDLHNNPPSGCANYSLLCFRSPAAQASGHLSAQPDYYGALVVSQLQGGTFVPVSLSDTSHNLRAYAVIHPGHELQVVLLNMESAFATGLSLRMPAGAPSAVLQRLTAPSLSSTQDVRFGGAMVQPSGRFHRTHGQKIRPEHGELRFQLPAASAALITIQLPRLTGVSSRTESGPR